MTSFFTDSPIRRFAGSGSSPAQQDTTRLIKEAAQITDIIGECVTLRRAGANLKGLCPFHAEKTPSFIVNPVRQSFHCYGCGEGGDVFDFMTKYYRLTFPEAIKQLAARYHIELPKTSFSPADQEKAQKRQALFSANERAASIWHEFLKSDPGGAPARDYLRQRGVSPETAAAYRLGYAPESWDFLLKRGVGPGITQKVQEEAGLIMARESGGYYDRFRDRLIFPIHDLSGRVAGFGGRILGPGEPKYLNSPETPVFTKSRILFGLFQHRDAIRQARCAVIVEGNFDMLSLAIHGVRHVAAPLGTALTAAQVRVLKGYADEVILLFDGDSAGLKAALRAVEIFLAEQVRARVAVLPRGHDPDSFIRERGREQLEKFLAEALPLPEFVFEQMVARHGLTLEGKGLILQELRPVIEALANNPLQRSVLISRFSERLGLDPEQVLAGFSAAASQSAAKRIAQANAGDAAAPNSRPVSLPRQQRQLLEFLILYPQFLPQFTEAGVGQLLTEPAARTILDHLRQVLARGAAASPEFLLEVLPEGGPERRFVSGLLIAAQGHDSEQEQGLPAKIAAEQLAWLKKMRLQKELEQLSGRIKQAQQQGDQELLLALSLEKTALNQALQSCTTGGPG